MPAKHANDLKKTYAKVAPGYEKTHQGDIELESLKKFISKIPVQSSILDLGAGNGRDSKWFFDQGYQVTMFDLSPEMLILAKEKVPNATVIQGDMTEMKFGDEIFDGVWARASLLHLTKDEAKFVVSKIFKMLKRGGIVFCTLKEGEGEKEIPDVRYGSEGTRFFSFYNEKEAYELFSNAGFSQIMTEKNTSKSGTPWVQVWGVKN